MSLAVSRGGFYFSSTPTIVLFFSCLILATTFTTLVQAAAAAAAAAAAEDSPATACVPPPLTVPASVPSRAGSQIVIAHRGASSHLPEHSLAAYRLALELGADYIEPDLIVTRDQQIIILHSADLNLTTDVAEKFPDRAEHSAYRNTTGFYAYNFDLDELKTLRIRQRLPTVRSTVYDGLFEIPTLTELLELIQHWNSYEDPLLMNATLTDRRAKPGIYAELKDVPWIQEDAGIDLNTVLFQHMHDHKDLWQEVIFDRLCDTTKLKIHEYNLPPLIVQSFDAKALKEFTERWRTTYNVGDADEATGTTKYPVPPTILLVDKEHCLEESFWFDVGEARGFLKGLGPDKACVLGAEWREFMERAIKFNLVVHPWTERPELEFVDSSKENPFATNFDEMMFLLCEVKVHGVFTESVDAGVRGVTMGCEEEEEEKKEEKEEEREEEKEAREKGASGSSAFAQCDADRENLIRLYIGLASCFTGVFASFLVSCCMGRRHRKRGKREMTVPTVELTPEDNEML